MMRKIIRDHGKFFEEYHAGVVNKLLHFFGFALWGIGVGSVNWVLILLSPLIFESGHLVNYFLGRRTQYDTCMIPIQLLTWVLFVLLAWILVGIASG